MESGDFMPRIMRLLAVSAFATVMSMSAVQAQDALQNDHGTMVVGGMEISVGAGVATLDLPDVRFGVLSQNSSTGGVNTVRTFPNDNNFDHEFGPSITAGIVCLGRDKRRSPSPASSPISTATTR